jgi:hypothetical protein
MDPWNVIKMYVCDIWSHTVVLMFSCYIINIFLTQGYLTGVNDMQKFKFQHIVKDAHILDKFETVTVNFKQFRFYQRTVTKCILTT